MQLDAASLIDIKFRILSPSSPLGPILPTFQNNVSHDGTLTLSSHITLTLSLHITLTLSPAPRISGLCFTTHQLICILDGHAAIHTLHVLPCYTLLQSVYNSTLYSFFVQCNVHCTLH